MKKLTFSALAVLFVFGLSTLFVSCGEEAAKDEVKEEVKEDVVKDVEEVVADVADYSAGKTLYTSTCQACHQENGEGLGETFPGLKGKACDITKVTNGVDGTAMVAFKNTLSDQQIADVANYINHSWENNFANVTAEDIAAVK